jgi:hypothetical protein
MVTAMPNSNRPSSIDGSLAMLLLVTVVAVAFLISQLV